MIDGKSVLAIVPARSGSKGIPDKNMACLGGLSLIARAGRVLSQISWIDRRVLSTDSPAYAEEGKRHGLDAPFLRPGELSGDSSPALDVIVHALKTCEQADNRAYDFVVLAEPTSPLREASDIDSTMEALLETGADSALTVSRLDTKCHPLKALAIVDRRLAFHSKRGELVSSRHTLEPLYARNGLCYCFRRRTLLEKKALITEFTVPVVTERPVANVDDRIDLLWAEFLLDKSLRLTDLPGDRP